MLEIVKVLMDYEKDPVGVEEMPQFSWKLKSDKRNVVQSAYRLQIAENRDFQTPVYDSGRVESSESAHVRPAGTKGDSAAILKSAVRYYVRVRVWTEEEESGWCCGEFVTALLDNREWKAPFVSAESAPACREESRGTLVRGDFSVGKGLTEAYAFTTALGLYQFYLNGSKVGTDEMTPGWTSYRRHLLYQTYDVTGCLKEGINTAGAMVGAGGYTGVMGLTRSRNNYGDQTDDGREEVICTGEDWKGADAPVVFSEIYHGETYDAALEIPGWCGGEEAGEDRACETGRGEDPETWHRTEIVPFDSSVLHAQGGARVTVIDRIPAKEVFVTPKGETVIDFGQNMAGRICVTGCGRKGDVIELRCFEILDAEGKNDHEVCVWERWGDYISSVLYLHGIPLRPCNLLSGHSDRRSVYSGNPSFGNGAGGRNHLFQPAVKPASPQLPVGLKRQFPGCSHRLSAAGRASWLDGRRPDFLPDSVLSDGYVYLL